jgi:tetratricopeptide (TPR) repeat protein
MNKKWIIVGLVVVLGLAGLGFYVYTSFKRPSSPNGADNNKPSTTDENQNAPAIIKVEPQTLDFSKLKVPDINRPITFSSDIPQNQRQKTEQIMKEIISRLEKNRYSFDDWLALGLHRKANGDFEGAREAWEFAALINPASHAAFGNLGVLYGYILEDSDRAEKDFLKAIENKPSESYWYVQLADFYRDVSKNIPKAKNILEKAAVAVPAEAEALRQYASGFGK